ncbi:MAG: copper chaperone PCu(A)C [Polaromonas sp.]|nr:copper chaperone PCu(A)C [Polaromonas sp.]
MTNFPSAPVLRILAALLLGTGASASFAHVVLAEKTATAGSDYKAAFKVGHGCDGSPTTGITVELPAGFANAKPVFKSGWSVGMQANQSGGASRSTVSWKAGSKDAALADGKRDEFVINGKLPNTTGPLWFKVLQTCENGSINWSEVPAAGTSTAGLKSPAALLDVQAVGAPSVQVQDAWVRATVPGQKGSGGFMKLTSKTDATLVGLSSPVAGVAEVHEMKMEGDVMRMRALDKGLPLPAGKTVELKSGGFHLMLMDLQQTLVAGSTVPVTLTFRAANGAESRTELKVPVAMSSPTAAGSPAAGEMDHGAHKH